MVKRKTAPPRKPFGPPADAKAGAAGILASAVKLYDRKNGHGADWRAVAEALFTAGFQLLDRLPDDQRQAMARRIHAGAYDRAVGNAPGGDSALVKQGPERAPGHDLDADHAPRAH
jgi:hypothetical protein